MLSLVYGQLTHLQICIAKIIDDVQVQDDGQVINKKNEKSYPDTSENMRIDTEEKRKVLVIWISHHQQLLR